MPQTFYRKEERTPVHAANAKLAEGTMKKKTVIPFFSIFYKTFTLVGDPSTFKFHYPYVFLHMLVVS